MKQTLILVDGHNFLFKSYSIPFKFYSANKTPLHVVTTFLRQVKRVLEIAKDIDQKEATHIAVVFDTQTSNSNYTLLKDYKANRKQDYSADQDSPFIHLPLIFKCLAALNIKYIEAHGVEADDYIATLAIKFCNDENKKTYIASTDSDFYQLLCPTISQIILKREGKYELLDRYSVKRMLDIWPEDYVLFKSMTGDKADNITGIPKVGKVRAAQIINKSIVLDLDAYQKLLELNKKLIKLNTNLENILTLDEMFYNPSNLTNQEIFKICEF